MPSALEKVLSDRRIELDKDIKNLQSELSGVQAQLHSKLREREITIELLGIHGNENGVNGASEGSLSGSDNEGRIAHVDGFEEAVEGMLKEMGEPMHVSQIEQSLRRGRIPIPGKGNQANIISRMRRSGGKFVRVAAGTYALSEWGMKELVTRKKRRLRGRR